MSAPLSTLVMQSCPFVGREGGRDAWRERCLESVEAWAVHQGYEYALEGDELFERNPSWLNEKLVGRGPIKSDVARLLWAQEALERYERVLWLDADVLIFAPERFDPLALCSAPAYALFGREQWVQPHAKGLRYGWRTFSNLCNALCAFERASPILPFYLYTATDMISRVDPQHIAPQMIGPKLLTALGNLTSLPSTHLLGSASPHLLADLARGEGEALGYFSAQEATRPVQERSAALNLCASLEGAESYCGARVTPGLMLSAIERLLGAGCVSAQPTHAQPNKSS